ncbi:MAG TPA: HAD-IA family hydrolase [Stellaceae bacterium]|nr:HAD-IA family hydrolase [Stellaceae bacterium]
MSPREGRRTLLLDFGGVIVRTVFECLEEIEGHFGLRRGSLDWTGPLDPARDEGWRAMLDGRISERDYWRERLSALGQLVGRELGMADVIAAMSGADANRAVRVEAAATVARAKAAGCRIGVLTNELERIYGRDAVAQFAILREMDAVVDGSRSGVRKPSPEAYAAALVALHSTAGEAVFIDDQPSNVEAAITVGITGVAFDVRDPALSFRAAERLLGL